MAVTVSEPRPWPATNIKNPPLHSERAGQSFKVTWPEGRKVHLAGANTRINALRNP